MKRFKSCVPDKGPALYLSDGQDHSQALFEIEQYAFSMGRSLRNLGVNINFAPVVDINTNPANPIIGFRSFGEDKYNVSNKALNYLKGMHHHGIMGAAKHFPGHCDT